jgi:hypothetical protein
MTAEQREDRSAELQREISREWLRYAIADAAILAPVVLVLVVGVSTGAIPQSAILPVALVGGGLSGVLVTYWVLARIRPLQHEREQIARVDQP